MTAFYVKAAICVLLLLESLPYIMSACGQCIDGPTTCDATTLVCPYVEDARQARCARGWMGLKCNGACDPGTWGYDCRGVCGKCEMGTCDVVTGRCVDGDCLLGYRPRQCIEFCDKGKWGKNCVNRCGFCANEDVCDAFTGDCPNGCQRYYTGSECDNPTLFWYRLSKNRVCQGDPTPQWSANTDANECSERCSETDTCAGITFQTKCQYSTDCSLSTMISKETTTVWYRGLCQNAYICC